PRRGHPLRAHPAHPGGAGHGLPPAPRPGRAGGPRGVGMSAATARTGGGGRRRVRARVEGTVQGVGFRPHVYRLATRLGVSGYVLNDAWGVLVEAEGEAPVVEGFLAALSAEAPTLARVERVRAEEMAPTGQAGFAIRESPRGGEPRAPVTADSA